MMTAALSSAVALILAAGAVEPRRSGQDSFLTRAVFAEGRVWMRSDAGVVFSVAEGEPSRREEPLPGTVLDLCAQSGQVIALTAEGGSWVVRRHSGGGWGSEATVAEESGFGALHCGVDAIAVVASNRVSVIRGGTTRAIALSRPLQSESVTSFHIERDRLYVGVNRGEWGGGLLRADLNTGVVSSIDRRSAELCSGPLNADCDPVQGVAPEPWKPGCVVAAIGLVHFMPRGRLVEICGEDVRVLLSRPYEAAREGTNPKKASDWETVAFFGVAADGNRLVAAGIDGIYRVSPERVEREPLPEFKDVGGMKVSFGVPGLVLVLTDVNSRKSVSGSVPLIVPRG
jgi:hypothetical protein